MRAVASEEPAPGRLLDWDSAFWGVRVGRAEGNVLSEKRWAELDAWARAHGVDCLYFLATADDPGTIGVAQKAGFDLVDVRIELAQPSTRSDRVARVRAYRSADLPVLREIARRSHRNTRFYADGHFSRERCADLYETWIVRSCVEGWADHVLVAELAGRPVGYVSLHFDPVMRRGSIGLIAVSEEATGHGLGAELVAGALGWCRDSGAESASVVSQGANVRAQRLFQRCGFRTTWTGLWFHRWYAR
jgi:dTDP-4-amino-4,6-dideoxy-D-galactose acyltransferase